jgi:hypothetical protein
MLLLTKAAEDEQVLDILMQHETASVASIGFHAQQAAEKLVKAAIKAAGAEYPLTHNVRALLELVEAAGIAVPEEFWDAGRLTPFAAQFRCDALPDEGGMDIDVKRMRGVVRDLRTWVEALIASKDSGEPTG